ncbi:MAG: S-methyl-5'-thioadenosine phosphorylase [Sulfobacillus sp.]
MIVAVIGGTGVYDAQWLENVAEKTIDTPYGKALVLEGRISHIHDPVYFMNRHGLDHSVPPHLVNYRANLFALRSLGVERVVATTAVGSLNVDFEPGTMVLADQFLDFTKARAHTFHQGGPTGVVHTDMTEPYCPYSRHVLQSVAAAREIPCHNGGVYVATEGPRFETPAEIRAFRLLGGDVVGMTGVPEVVLARELGLCYSTVSLVTNFAAGLASAPLTHQEVLEVMAQNVAHLRTVLVNALPALTEPGDCQCQRAPT